MAKFFVSPEAIHANHVSIVGEDAAHIVRVLRMKPADEILLCDAQGMDYKGVISSLRETSVDVDILQTWRCENEPPIAVTLFQGLPKGDKMEWIIQKCVELGVSEIVPVATEFAVAKMADQKSETKKLVRWNKISQEAAKQCGRGILPQVTSSMNLKAAVARASTFDLVFVPYEKDAACQEHALRALLEKFKAQNSLDSTPAKSAPAQSAPRVAFFIGPEGGFSEKEMDLFLEYAIPPISLGKRILRTETAGMVVLSILMYELENGWN